MRKFLTFFGIWLGLVTAGLAADTMTLATGTTISGDIVKSDDVGVMVHTTGDEYPNLRWPDFSQETLKKFAANPKYYEYVRWFIQPTAGERQPKPVIQIKAAKPMTLPEHPSLFGGLIGSSLGLFMLLLLYAANLYCAYEVGLVRGKPLGLVIGTSAVLPILGQIIFLSQPMKAADGEEPAAADQGATPAPPPGQEEIQIVAASWQPPEAEKQAQPQVFSRGKFTLNRRFVETRFAGFMGEPKGDALNYSMEIKTMKSTFAVARIKQVGPTELVAETPKGPLPVAFADILEIKLIPKPA